MLVTSPFLLLTVPLTCVLNSLEMLHYNSATHIRLAMSLCDPRAIDLEEVKILKQRMIECQRREEVNAPQRCREHTIAYLEAFKKYKSQGKLREPVLTNCLSGFSIICRLEGVSLNLV